MTPQTRCRVEAVVLQKPPSVPGDEPDRGDEVGEDRLGDEVVDVDANPAGFDALTAVGDLAVELAGRSRSMPNSRCPYGPAQEQPPRDWIPNRSLSNATT